MKSAFDVRMSERFFFLVPLGLDDDAIGLCENIGKLDGFWVLDDLYTTVFVFVSYPGIFDRMYVCF